MSAQVNSNERMFIQCSSVIHHAMLAYGVVQQNLMLAGAFSLESGATSIILWSLFPFLCVGYAVVRYLKKYRNFGRG